MKVVKFPPLALLVIHSTWPEILGRREVCREIVIDKQKLFRQTPTNIKDCQLDLDEIPEDDLDEEAIEPFMDLEDSKARINHIQCKDTTPCSEDTKEAAVYEEKDGDWGGGMPLPDPGAYRPNISGEGHSGPSAITFEGKGTLTTREAPEEEQEEVGQYHQNHVETARTRQPEEGCKTPGPRTATDAHSEVGDKEKEEPKALW